MRRPELVRGLRVLELGSGCGPCGLLAARLGAKQVFSSNLDVCVSSTHIWLSSHLLMRAQLAARSS